MTKQQIEAPADEFELSVEFLRKQLLQPFSNARKPIEEAKKLMQDEGVSNQLIAQNLSIEKGVMERHHAETIKLTTNPRTGKLWDLDTLDAAGMTSDAERENIVRAHGGKEPPYYYVSTITRVFDDKANKSYLTAHCLFEGIAVGNRPQIVNPEPNRKINCSWTMGVEHSTPIEWITTQDGDEEKRVARYNAANWNEGYNSPNIYTIPWDRSIAEKLLARGKDGLPALAIKNLSNHRTYGVKSVEDFCTDDITGLVKSYEEPKPTYKFDISPQALADFMKYQQQQKENGEPYK